MAIARADPVTVRSLPKDKGDAFTVLYQGSFDANAPLSNALTANDDAYRDGSGPVWWWNDTFTFTPTPAYGSGFHCTLVARRRQARA